jgi:hypothetical protein
LSLFTEIITFFINFSFSNRKNKKIIVQPEKQNTVLFLYGKHFCWYDRHFIIKTNCEQPTHNDGVEEGNPILIKNHTKNHSFR